jgi:adenylosuccinate lyase
VARLEGDERLGLAPGTLDVDADPLRFTGAASAQVAAVVARVAEITAAHPAAATYAPGAIL